MRRLPDPSAPLVVGDGIAIPPSSAQTFARIEVPTATQAQRLVTNTRRKLADLPALPKQMNAFAVLLVYTASGLSDSEISVAMGVHASQIARMREHEVYKQLEGFIVDAVREQSKSEVTAILARAEVKSAERIEMLIDSEDHKVALMASKDVLDRRGHAPKMQVDLRAEMMNTFRIEYVDKRGEAPVIDMEVDNGDSSGPER